MSAPLPKSSLTVTMQSVKGSATVSVAVFGVSPNTWLNHDLQTSRCAYHCIQRHPQFVGGGIQGDKGLGVSAEVHLCNRITSEAVAPNLNVCGICGSPILSRSLCHGPQLSMVPVSLLTRAFCLSTTATLLEIGARRLRRFNHRTSKARPNSIGLVFVQAVKRRKRRAPFEYQSSVAVVLARETPKSMSSAECTG